KVTTTMHPSKNDFFSIFFGQMVYLVQTYGKIQLRSMADERILITGGSGLIGSRLTELLASKGWEVAHLGRSKKSTLAKHFTWNIDNGRVEENALDNVHTIVHLAGASVGSGRWTRSRKKEILRSEERRVGKEGKARRTA